MLSFYKHITSVLALTILLGFCSNTANAQFYNGSQMDFGKNRVQYDQFLWTYYRYEKYDIYLYTGGRELAIYTAKSVEKHIRELENIFDYQLNDRVQIILYNKHSHFRQSNIGLGADESYNVGGVTRLIGTKLFVYYEGDHKDFEQQIRAGIAEILINELIYGGNWREALKNSTLLTLPEWYVKGLVSYVSKEWNDEIENKVKDGVLSGKYKKFNHLAGDDAVYAGHAMWHYIIQVYGANVLANIIYMTKMSRNVESGFLYVLGVSLKNISLDWVDYYANLYRPAELNKKMPEQNALKIKSKKNKIYSQLKVSPDGKMVAYTTNEMGKLKVYTYNTETKKRKKVKRWGFKLDRINDYKYPLLTWHPTGEILAIVTEEKGEPWLHFYNPKTKTMDTRQIFLIDDILDISYSHDGKRMVFSAVAEGQTDIYLYSIASNAQEAITKDVYDDLHPRFINNSTQIIFASNRWDDTLRFRTKEDVIPNLNKDIFIYDLNSKSPLLRRVTNTPDVDETQPRAFVDDKFSFLTVSEGIRSRYIGAVDSVISHIDTVEHYRYVIKTAKHTDYPRNILEHEFNPQTGKYSELIYHKGKFRFFAGNYTTDLSNIKFQLPPTPKKSSTKTPAKENIKPVIQPEKKDTISASTKFKTVKVFEENNDKKIDINNYQFEEQLGIEKKETKQPDKNNGAAISDKSKLTDERIFKLPEQRNYNLTYYPDYLVTQLDNSFMNQNYQPFNPVNGGYINPGMNVFTKIGMTDLFEDKRISGAMRLSTSLTNNEYYLSYEDRSKRLDKQYILHRNAMTFSDGFSITRIHTHEAAYKLKWAFNEVKSLRGLINLRQDRFVAQATDFTNLQKPNYYDYWVNAKVEYVFDNTIKRGLNLYNGVRYKIFVEQYKQLNQKDIDITILGGDFRYYQKIHRDFIWANRIAAGTSFGSRKLLFYAGGVDNWIAPKTNNETPVDLTQNYIFQTLGTPIRGFIQNTRNGNNFAVVNSELRLPVFKYFINQPIKSDFIQNFQIIAFGDIGTAWVGQTPFSEENTSNTTFIDANPLYITLKNQREPVIGGYGWGLRSRIWGYFIRADWAWGVENYEVGPRVFYLSFSLDF
jgi:hypothetical protein